MQSHQQDNICWMLKHIWELAFFKFKFLYIFIFLFYVSRTQKRRLWNKISALGQNYQNRFSNCSVFFTRSCGEIHRGSFVSFAAAALGSRMILKLCRGCCKCHRSCRWKGQQKCISDHAWERGGKWWAIFEVVPLCIIYSEWLWGWGWGWHDTLQEAAMGIHIDCSSCFSSDDRIISCFLNLDSILSFYVSEFKS